MTLSAKSINPQIAYGYNIQGWLKSMESGSFCEELHYNEGQGKHLYGGNISSMAWRRKGEAGDRGYKLYYDNLGRLTGSEFSEQAPWSRRRTTIPSDSP